MPFDLQKDLNPSQLEAVTFGSGPLLILAGAGSGKTRALTYRAAYLVRDQKVDPSSILLLTFTNKAAGEMQARLQKLVDTSLPFAGTFHSFSARILRRYGHVIGVAPNFVIYDDADQLDLIKKILKDLDLSPKDFRPRSLLSQIGAAKNELLSPDDYKNLARGSFQLVAAKVYTLYQQAMRDASALDFDDLLLFLLKLLQSSPQTLANFQHRFQYVLVDEYQDTNRAQYLIAKLIAQIHRNLNVVGDASQSIYRWRGADYRNLDYLKTDFPELTTIKLEQNYRSTQIILDAATNVIQKNTSHPILKLWTDSSGGDLINLYQADDQNDEALYTLKHLGNSQTTTAILYRTNAQSRAFEEIFIRHGIAYVLVGGTKFYERKEIKDVLSFLRLIQNPNDLVCRDRAMSLGKKRFALFEAALEKINPQELSTSDLFTFVLNTTQYLDRYDKDIDEDLSRIENVKELQSVASQFSHLADFLENVALVENNSINNTNNNPPIASAKGDNSLKGQKNTPTADNPVTLMTIHSAKGLEFDQVFVVGLEEGLFPHSRSLLEPAELEEERRLCYVALTRARSQLHLTFSHNRLYFGGYTNGIASRFISEIPEHLLHPVNFDFSSPVSSKSPHRPHNLDDATLDRFLDGDLSVDDLLKL